jgi:hypothetical protein
MHEIIRANAFEIVGYINQCSLVNKKKNKV